MPTLYHATCSKGIKHTTIVGNEHEDVALHGPGIRITHCVIADRDPRTPEWASSDEIASRIKKSHALDGREVEILEVQSMKVG